MRCMSRWPWFLPLLAAGCLVMAPSASRAQMPLPIPVPDQKPDKRWTKVRRLAQLKAKVKALQTQLMAIRELSNWASTNAREMQRLYTSSRVNLEQARAAILKAQGKPVTPYVPPKGFEIEPVVAAAKPADYYRLRGTSKVSVVPPDSFRLYVRVLFPKDWIAQRRKVSIGCKIYSERYLPMATRYQNTTKAIYRVSAFSKIVTRRETVFNSTVHGLGLLPGRYFASCVVSTRTYPSTYLVSLGMFRVKGKLPPAVRVLLPHYRDWYRSYKSVVGWRDLKAKVRGKSIQLSGSYERKDFARGQKPVHIEAKILQGQKSRVVLRRYQKLTRRRMSFRGRYFNIKEHGLKPGTYTLRVTLYTEYSTGTRWVYMRGSRADRSVQVTIK